jgi:osmotically-inducible protein OsmY
MMKRHGDIVRFAAFTALGAAAMVTASCERDRPRGAPSSEPAEEAVESSQPAATPEPEPPLDDGDIQTAIVKEIALDGSVDIDDVQVSVTDGIATLMGTVDNILAKNRAVGLARLVKGTRSVSDQIEVDVSQYPTGAELASNVELALILDPAADGYEVTVTAQGHEVTLHGTVDSHQERMLSQRLAEGVAGVSKVTNDIEVDWPEERSDPEIEKDVQARLKWDALVDDGLIDVSVSDGDVTLSGTVGSAAEWSRAKTDAWVMGAGTVSAEDLDVERWARDDDLRGDKYATNVTDGGMKDAIRDALLYDPRVSVLNVKVNVDHAIAKLSGTVPSRRARDVAGELAHDTVGVLSVINDVQVKPEEAVADDVLSDRASSALALDPVVEGSEITVGVEDGVVTLTGDVDSYFQKAEAEHVIAGLDGARTVNNDLSVSTPDKAFVFDAYLSPYYPEVHTLSFTLMPPIKSDGDLVRDVSEQLFWSPFVDRRDVTVVADGGRVTLLGTVDSWREYEEAATNALEAGALSVDNRLQVR